MKKLLLILVATTFIFTSCQTHKFTIGEGSQTGETKSALQFYAFFGLMPLGKVDTKKMAGGATDYEITTEVGALSYIINLFGSYVTILARDVRVKK